MRKGTRTDMKPTKEMKELFNYLQTNFGHFMVIAVKPGERDPEKGLGVNAFCAGYGDINLVAETFLSVEESQPFMNALKDVQLKRLLGKLYNDLTAHDKPVKKTRKSK